MTLFNKRKDEAEFMFKLDTHVHTKETSFCGNIFAADVVKLYKEAGYDGIIITDHYYDGYFETLGDLSWIEKVDCYLRGYKRALEQGEKLGLKVFLGMEIRFTENPNDYLVYGITEEYLKENPELYKLGLKEFKKHIEKDELLIFQAHPFRNGMVVADPTDLHGVEVFNGNLRHDSRNEKAVQFANENHLLMSSGSDFHELEDLARGGMVFDDVIHNSSELIDHLRNQRYSEIISS